jgi:gluconokinase
VIVREQTLTTSTSTQTSTRARHDGAVNPPVIVVMGVTGVGKTTVGALIAEHLGIAFVDADDFHVPENIERMRRGEPLDDAARTPWLDRLNAQLREHAGGGVVLACSALKQTYRTRLTRGVENVEFVVLSGPPDLLRERIDARTGHFAPASLLPSQIEALEIPADSMVMGVARPPEAVAASILVNLGLA